MRRKAVIRCIKNQRRISLWNCGTKILSKTISNDLKVSLLRLISSHQTAYVITDFLEKVVDWAGDSRYIYQNELDKACFQHHMADGDCKGLLRRTVSDKHYVKRYLTLL